MADTTHPVLLILADISGYTRYMTANAKTLAHSHTIIRELIQTVVHHAGPSLRVAKLEGDAVFLYARLEDRGDTWETVSQGIGERLVGFFGAFHTRLAELRGSTTCRCSACTHIEGLHLKVLVHRGEALFHEVAGFEELAGVDVIIVHRLLKNSVRAREYLLLTEAAAECLSVPADSERITERYDDVGVVKGRLHIPRKASVEGASQAVRVQAGLSWHLRLWTGVLRPDPESARFRNVESRSGRGSRRLLSLLFWALTPVLLPVHLGTAALRLWLSGGRSGAAVGHPRLRGGPPP